ncbi:MAG TPA: DUF488 domain-containing protein [Candidatus Acidoferrum sp.]|nr:DUF488 domain-containing protein [Candidatus Acidoferrum sp.]
MRLIVSQKNIQSLRIFSIGHSNRTLQQLLEVLLTYDIEAVSDVRSVPSSRANPHFNKEVLDVVLPRSGIEYEWMGKGLGGFRHRSLEQSPNAGWKVKGFRNYADYALSDDFSEALSKLEMLAEKRRTAYMCAELLYTRCHRRIISDYLTVRGWEVVHIIDHSHAMVHRITPFAKIDGNKVTYPTS